MDGAGKVKLVKLRLIVSFLSSGETSQSIENQIESSTKSDTDALQEKEISKPTTRAAGTYLFNESYICGFLFCVGKLALNNNYLC